jgi:hypothetical protein
MSDGISFLGVVAVGVTILITDGLSGFMSPQTSVRRIDPCLTASASPDCDILPPFDVVSANDQSNR